MSTVSRIASARFHRAGSAEYGAGGQAVAEYLRSHTGDDYAIVEIERDQNRFSLIVDPEWIRLAHATQEIDRDLINDMELPRSCVLAVVDGWVADWASASADLAVARSADEIPHLRLTSLRPSPSDADRNAPRR